MKKRELVLRVPKTATQTQPTQQQEGEKKASFSDKLISKVQNAKKKKAGKGMSKEITIEKYKTEDKPQAMENKAGT